MFKMMISERNEKTANGAGTFVVRGWIAVLLFTASAPPCRAQLVLLGDNAPYENINDGDFSKVKAYWRKKQQSPDWKTTWDETGSMGIHNGTLFNTCAYGIAESAILNTNPNYQHPKKGDVIEWSFGVDMEYTCSGTLSFALVFGDYERVLKDNVNPKGSDKAFEYFKGTYTLTSEDAESGLPFVRVKFYAEDEIKIFLDDVNIRVLDEKFVTPRLAAISVANGFSLTWTDVLASNESMYTIYKQFNQKGTYQKVGTTDQTNYVDENFISGVTYSYVVTRVHSKESIGSNKAIVVKKDQTPPAPPTSVQAEVMGTEIKISWQKSKDRDASSYSVYRSDVDGRNRRLIANKIRKTNYLDYVPAKGEGNTYMVYAHDYSGNVSTDFAKTEAKLEIIKGTSFSDLILPMPIHRELTSETWGTEGVLPRDIDNGIEHPEWSYWGGRPVYDKTDGKYHMLVVRWPANAIKGHWEWPNSTVSQTISDTPTGPYEVVNDLAYDYLNGHGHNADVTLLNDGSYLLYIVRKGESHLLKSNTMKGPWKPLGKMVVDWKATNEDPRYTYKYYNNLSGVQLEDGRLLFVTKAGEMIINEGPDPLGPYQVITEQMKGNPIIPEQYRKSVYEDPVLWKDEVQYHMLINAFLDKRCIYLRSPDGIHWKFNPGTAYTPNNTSYEDGTQTNWYKLERPHVLTDPYGRATHLSLAVIDVPKRDDLAGDRHNSKNLILPLVVHKRLKMLNKTPVTAKTKKITVRVISEKGFDAQKDLDIESLRFGASEEVDHGRGCRVVNTRKRDRDLILTFDGEGNGMTPDHFVCKLTGKTKSGDLVIAYSKLKSD